MKLYQPGKQTGLHFCFILFILLLFTDSCATEKNASSSTKVTSAPEIISKDTDGNALKLSDTKGKLVLVEFWSASSTDSRKNHPEMDKLYRQYKDKTFKNGAGFTIFSVAVDNNFKAWVDAIQQDSITWTTQGCDLKGWDSESVFAYDVHSVPKYFLIDGDGKILSKNVTIKDLNGILKKYKK